VHIRSGRELTVSVSLAIVGGSLSPTFGLQRWNRHGRKVLDDNGEGVRNCHRTWVRSVICTISRRICQAYSWKLCTAQAVTARALFHLSTEICVGVILLCGDSKSNKPSFCADLHASVKNVWPSRSRPYFASTRSESSESAHVTRSQRKMQ
jgi:hypothetical protein